MGARVRVTGSGRLNLPAEIRQRHGLAHGGEVVIEDRGDAIVLRTLDQAIAQAQTIAQRLVRDKPSAGVESFLAERHREAAEE